MRKVSGCKNVGIANLSLKFSGQQPAKKSPPGVTKAPPIGVYYVNISDGSEGGLK